MTDGIPSNATHLPAQGAAGGSRLYRSESVREVRARAEFVQQTQSNEERAGVDRLRRIAGSGTQFDPNAPRGFYLNIRV